MRDQMRDQNVSTKRLTYQKCSDDIKYYLVRCNIRMV